MQLSLAVLLLACIFVAGVTTVCATSCDSRCNQLTAGANCQCNAACQRHSDCCYDYWTFCKSGTTELDVSEIAQTLWVNDINRVAPSDITVDIQGRVSFDGNTDRAPRRLFRYVNPNVFTRPTYAKFRALLNNYNWDPRRRDIPSNTELREIEQFLDAILATRVMTEAEQFLRNHGVLHGASDAFRETLRALWFTPYSRSSRGVINSSGFEHVFIGELSRGSIAGLHSWVRFYLLEAAGELDYQGYVRKTEPDLLGAQLIWHSYRKSMANFFLHASPEFEIAIYTICALVKPHPQVCEASLNGHRVVIQTWDIPHTPGLQVGSAYPRIG